MGRQTALVIEQPLSFRITVEKILTELQMVKEKIRTVHIEFRESLGETEKFFVFSLVVLDFSGVGV